jgi:hypothetical protein
VPANDGGLSLGQAHVARLTLSGAVNTANGKDSACALPFPCV